MNKWLPGWVGVWMTDGYRYIDIGRSSLTIASQAGSLLSRHHLALLCSLIELTTAWNSAVWVIVL